ncbi:AbrB family transcriptional regulator [Cryobacterium sp. N19]|uniref:AbrB family transcriptional regulator n=1 Tax=Cryobacterium sp. N19 TaxID=2048288 RepID=UPI000CE41083|nr:AbrB family transcriptional regulator [Cryobacterium sp. N19]
MTARARTPGASPAARGLVDALVLLAGGFGGAVLLTLVHLPAGALIGAVLGSMSVNKLTDISRRRSAPPSTEVQAGAPTEPAVSSRRLPAIVRIVGQVLLGVMAGARLDAETLGLLAASLVPLVLAVIVLLGLTMALARYLFVRHGVDPVTAVMAAAPGGISELAVAAQRQGAVMHVVLAFHLFRVLLVVLVVLPLVILALRTW